MHHKGIPYSHRLEVNFFPGKSFCLSHFELDFGFLQQEEFRLKQEHERKYEKKINSYFNVSLYTYNLEVYNIYLYNIYRCV